MRNTRLLRATLRLFYNNSLKLQGKTVILLIKRDATLQLPEMLLKSFAAPCNVLFSVSIATYSYSMKRNQVENNG